jgi:hypothetical protein
VIQNIYMKSRIYVKLQASLDVQARSCELSKLNISMHTCNKGSQYRAQRDGMSTSSEICQTKGNNMTNAPMNTSGHGMDRKWAIGQGARRTEGAEVRVLNLQK